MKFYGTVIPTALEQACLTAMGSPSFTAFTIVHAADDAGGVPEGVGRFDLASRLIQRELRAGRIRRVSAPWRKPTYGRVGKDEVTEMFKLSPAQRRLLNSLWADLAQEANPLSTGIEILAPAERRVARTLAAKGWLTVEEGRPGYNIEVKLTPAALAARPPVASVG